MTNTLFLNNYLFSRLYLMAIYIRFPDYDITIYPLVNDDNHSFLKNSNYSRLYLIAVIVFQTMISQFTRLWKMTPTLFWTTLIFPDSTWWLYLLSRLWYQNLPAGGRWHPLFFEQLKFFQTQSDGCDCFPDYDITINPLVEDDTHSFLNNSNFSRLYWPCLFSRLWYHNLPTGRRRHPLHRAQYELQCCWLPGMDFFFLSGC